MKKYKMPTVTQFLEKKRIYGPKKDPIWVALEKEMLANIANKPYNERVGRWLRFLKELRLHKHREAKRKEKRLQEEAGPAWYMELSIRQKEVLKDLRSNIHQDLLEDLPRRIRKSLSDLGITLKIPNNVLMKAMSESIEDPGVFIWILYTSIYKKPPNELQAKYDMNAMILMSCLVCIDLEECENKLKNLTCSEKPVVEKPKKPKPKKPEVKQPFGEYLQRTIVPHYYGRKKKKVSKGPDPLGYKVRLRSDESYENLRKNTNFLEKRKERNKKEKQKERICNYKFWEAPSTLRNTDPKMAAYVEKLRMIKKKAKQKYKAPYENVQYLISGVSFTGERPNYILTAVSLLPTGFIPINGGCAFSNGEYVTTILGYWKYPKEEKEQCDSSCDCITKWEDTVMDYLKDSKCKCGHMYDLYNQGPKSKEKYFYPPTRHGPHWFDRAKIYQMDPTEDFIKDTFKLALKSNEETPTTSTPTLSASELKESELLGAFFADLSDTPLMIPHLPDANKLNNLKAWARKRVKGPFTPKQHRKMIIKSQRRWLDLKHIDFRARANRIPFTQDQITHMKWSHRGLVQKLFDKLLEDYVTRNRIKQVEQTRLWWSTTKFDAYPSQRFLDIFFTYMPGRLKDTHFINPYCSDLTPKYGAKTCPLE